ncbi:MAG TPA: hypothetical protein VG299_03660, partial [Candidatus Dormibacteraeota bacterium]|nr:hypothetical protein [Candidatus Dormibacteraeota bacterium]
MQRPRPALRPARANKSAKLQQQPWWWRSAPWLFVGVACVFGLLTMSGELTIVQPLNDEAMHFEMVRWSLQQIHEGN